MDPYTTFRQERQARLQVNAVHPPLRDATAAFLLETIRAQYSYNFEWLGRPIIQVPQDYGGAAGGDLAGPARFDY